MKKNKIKKVYKTIDELETAMVQTRQDLYNSRIKVAEWEARSIEKEQFLKVLDNIYDTITGQHEYATKDSCDD